jgi:hypothetical protein
MNKLNFKYLITITLSIFCIISYCDYKREKEYNDYKCETEKLELKGVIDGVNHKSNYMQAHIIGIEKWLSLNISETKYNEGFSKNCSYEIGDSIIKKSNSLEFIIKKENRKAIYILDCEK